LEVVCDEHGIGGSGEYCGDNDAHLGRSNVFYHEASGGKYMPRVVLFNLEPGVKSPLGELFSQENLLSHTRGRKHGRRPLQKG
jgi:tubulin beta